MWVYVIQLKWTSLWTTISTHLNEKRGFTMIPVDNVKFWILELPWSYLPSWEISTSHWSRKNISYQFQLTLILNSLLSFSGKTKTNSVITRTGPYLKYLSEICSSLVKKKINPSPTLLYNVINFHLFFRK